MKNKQMQIPMVTFFIYVYLFPSFLNFSNFHSVRTFYPHLVVYSADLKSVDYKHGRESSGFKKARPRLDGVGITAKSDQRAGNTARPEGPARGRKAAGEAFGRSWRQEELRELVQAIRER